jgi:hypothetical protein
MDRTFVLKGIGIFLLLIGVASAIIGPYEIFAFYLFSDGGRFHYEGFGFGSFTFANIAWQIIGYYVIAFLCLSLGYGHLRLRRWIPHVMQSLLWCGLIVGIPLAVIFLFMLSVKDVSVAAWVFVVLILAMLYSAGQVLLIRFYRSRNVQLTIAASEIHSSGFAQRPLPILVVTILFIFYIVILHVPLFVNGVFPAYGFWLSDLHGFVVLDALIVSLAFLAWGVFMQRFWAWVGSILYLSLLTSTIVVTLANSTLAQMLQAMKLPGFEQKLLEGIPLTGIHFAPFVGIPLALTLGVLIHSRQFFKPPEKDSR